MIIHYDKGIIVKHGGSKIILDPEHAKIPIGIKTIVTHGHADHTQIVPSEASTYLTEETLDLYNAAQSRTAKDIIIKEMNEPFEIGPFEIELIPAGHLLGAVQVIVRQGESSFLYTGDFCPEELLTVQAAKIPKDIDMISIDATYGNKNLYFQSRDIARKGLFTWIFKMFRENKIPVINIAQMGGAQEIIRYINSMFPNLPVITHPVITKISKVYLKHEVKLVYTDMNDEQATELMNGKCVILLPRSTKNYDEILSRDIMNKASKCIVTGQSAKFPFSKFDYAVPLSTHASFTEIIKTIKEINPLHVLTNFGFHSALADDICSNGDIKCDAESIKNISNINIPALKGISPPKVQKPLDQWFD